MLSRNVPCHVQDREDDVRAVSAEALLPVVSLIAQQETEAASDTESALWDLLLDVDDLSVSTGEHAPAAGSTECLLSKCAKSCKFYRKQYLSAHPFLSSYGLTTLTSGRVSEVSQYVRCLP